LDEETTGGPGEETTRESDEETMVIRLEHDDKSACSSYLHRQLCFNFAIPEESSKSIARTSASSSTLSDERNNQTLEYAMSVISVWFLDLL